MISSRLGCWYRIWTSLISLTCALRSMCESCCHCRRGLLGCGIASSWGTEEPRLGEVSRLGFWRMVVRLKSLHVLGGMYLQFYKGTGRTAGVIFSFNSSKVMFVNIRLSFFQDEMKETNTEVSSALRVISVGMQGVFSLCGVTPCALSRMWGPGREPYRAELLPHISTEPC